MQSWDFKTWIDDDRFLTESKNINISVAPGLEQHRDQAIQALLTYLSRYGSEIEPQAALSRYHYTLEKVRDGYGYTSRTLQFRYVPIENRRASDEIVPADDDRRNYYPPDWDGKTGKRVYPTPKDAIEDIPDNPALAWRGLSWEEWKIIQKRGWVQSLGQHNFSNQANLTFYGPDPGTGVTYAGGFAPIAFKVAPKRPGIVIGVPRNMLKDHKQNPGIPQGELAHEGPLPLSYVAEVYMLVATKGRSGTLELIIDYKGGVSEGSRFDAGIQYAIRRVK